MSDEQKTVPPEQVQPETTQAQPDAPKTPVVSPVTAESWQEVGKQFAQLGQSLATAVRASWYDEENRKRLQAM